MKIQSFLFTATILVIVCWCQIEANEPEHMLWPIGVDKKWGYIDVNGEVVIPPRFESASEFFDGLAVVKEEGLYGYINLQGNLITAYKYTSALPFKNGEAIVATDSACFVINMRGERLRDTVLYYQPKHSDNEPVWYSKSSLMFSTKSSRYRKDSVYTHRGYIFRRNNVDNSWQLTSNGREIAQDIDISSFKVLEVSDDSTQIFSDGYNMARTPNTWMVLDSIGHAIAPLIPFDFPSQYVQRHGKYVLMMGRTSHSKEYNRHWFIVWNFETSAITVTNFEYAHTFAANDKLLYVRDEDKEGYVNEELHFVWSKSVQTPPNRIPEYLRGIADYRASSPDLPQFLPLFGGEQPMYFATELEIPPAQHTDSCQITLDESAFNVDSDTIRFAVQNTTDERQWFDSEGSLLNLVLEAKDQFGMWRPIEYRDWTGCGNDAHSVYLEPNQQWKLTAIRPHGDLETQLRFRLIKKHYSTDTTEILHSTPFPGTVHPGAFWFPEL